MEKTVKEFPLVSIITIAYNRPGILQQLLRSIYNSTYKKIEVIVVNNSREEFRQGYEEVLKEFPEVRHIWSGKNLLISGAWNAGFKEAKGDIILFCGDDYVFEKDMIKHMVDTINKSERVGVVGAVMYYARTDKILNAGNSFSFYTGTISINNAKSEDYEVDIIDSIVMIKRRLLKEIGLFDEENFPFYLESADLCMRAKLRGYKCVISSKAKVWHEYFAQIALRVPEPDRYENLQTYFYLMRSKIRYIRKYANTLQKISFFSIFLSLLACWHIGIIAVRSKHKPILKIKYLIKGIFSGLLGKL